MVKSCVWGNNYTKNGWNVDVSTVLGNVSVLVSHLRRTHDFLFEELTKTETKQLVEMKNLNQS